MKTSTMHLVTKAKLEAIGNAGFVVSLTGDGEGNHVVEAINEQTGERCVVRSMRKN